MTDGGDQISPSQLLCHGMVVLALRTYEPWTISSVLAGVVIAAGLVAVLILAVQRRNR